MGYHKKVIPRGVYGEVSKIQEEVEELVDAVEQDAKIMVLCELSDIIGSVDGYLSRYYPGIKLDDLIKMAQLNKSAFIDGTRKSED